ncbi:MAG: type II toxin-antitoxin system prevent-host-death family antitoxin [Opitutaceae bacterium]|nr:type II toxin-antitoxin system prevent-host-death family antitoxin [Opitutaceae bacterium]
MKSTVTVTEGQNAFPALVREAENGAFITITRHDNPVACVVGHERMRAIAETLEILANPQAMRAIKAYKSGKTTFGTVGDIPE